MKNMLFPLVNLKLRGFVYSPMSLLPTTFLDSSQLTMCIPWPNYCMVHDEKLYYSTFILVHTTNIYNTTIITNNLLNKPSWSRSLSFWWWSRLGAWMRSGLVCHLRTCSRTSLENLAYFYTIYVLSECLLHKKSKTEAAWTKESIRIFTKFNFPSWQLSI